MTTGGLDETRLDRATDAVLAGYALFGNLHGKAIPLDRWIVREIVAVALAAADAASRQT